MVDHSDAMERTCEIADFLTLRHCKRCMIENPIVKDEGEECTRYSEEAQGIFNDYYDFLEPIVKMKFKEKFVDDIIGAGEDLEDRWDSFDDETDINIWTDDDGIIHANSYDVVNKRIVTDHWQDIKVKQFQIK